MKTPRFHYQRAAHRLKHYSSGKKKKKKLLCYKKIWAARNNIEVQPPHLWDMEWVPGGRVCIIIPNETCKASLYFLFTWVNARLHSGTRYAVGISTNSKLIWLWRKGNHRMYWISTSFAYRDFSEVVTQTKNESPEMDLTRKNDHENSILILLSHLMLPAHLERNRFRD